jgi:geranylgeranyl diphosphate synthase, type I
MRDQRPAIAPVFMAEIAARVETRIAALLDTDAVRWTTVDPELGEPLASLRRLVMGGGKRLRPAFCYWAFVGRGGRPQDPRIADAGAALELLHTCALIHDDVIDGSERRHGTDTIHVAFGRRHTEASWRGNGRHFGEGVAILVGDLAFVYADMLLGAAPAAAYDVFHQLRLEVNIGQYLDLLGSAAGGAGPEGARRICQYKSAKYTVERPLHLGAALADPDGLALAVGPLTAYGLPLGEAFQLKDDLLGTFGDSTVTGKPVGDDLREGKPTLLYALARGASAGAAARMLDERFGSTDLTADEVVALQDIFEETGARAQVEATVDRLVDQSLAAASALPVTEEARRALMELARFVAGRDH